MSYYVCSGRTPSDLQREVALFMRHGYVPQGGVVAVGERYNLTLMQAMVEQPKEKKK